MHVRYETRFLITWPEHLGEGMSYLDMHGSMWLIPTLGM